MNANGVTVTGTRAAAAKYSDQVGQPQSTAVSKRGRELLDEAEQIGDVVLARRAGSGAMPKPQLPMTIVVMPWIGSGSSDGSQNISRS